MKKIKDMLEIPERCDHPYELLSPTVNFDLMDQPYRKCTKCGEDICGRDHLQYLRKIYEDSKAKKVQRTLDE